MSILLIISTCVVGFSHIIPVIIKYVINWLYSENDNELLLKNDTLVLEQDMSKISIVDEFSKYAKLQRKYIKIKEKYKNEVSTRLSSRAKAQLFFMYAAKLFNWIIMVMLVTTYRGEAVVILPKGALWPLQDTLSWPGNHPDSISFAMWTGISCALLT